MPSYVDSTGVTYLTSDIKALADATYPANATIVNGYNSSSAYAVGDFCIHGGLFYKCNTAIASGGEAWNSSHWTQTNVTSEWGTKMVVLSYGHNTWNDFLAAFNANAIVYCKASSNNDPGSGSQGRMAFMAFVNYSSSTPTSVEFQYYRSVSSHTNAQQGDQVFIYKLESTNGGKWTVTTREAATKMVAGTGLSSSYSSGTLTMSLASGYGIPSGGTTGQVLAKNSNTDRDLAWVNQSGGGGSGGEFVVTVTFSNHRYSADKTYNEILAAINDGQIVVVKYDRFVFSLSRIESNGNREIYFTSADYRIEMYIRTIWITMYDAVNYAAGFFEQKPESIPGYVFGLQEDGSGGYEATTYPDTSPYSVMDQGNDMIAVFNEYDQGSISNSSLYRYVKSYITSEYREDYGGDSDMGHFVLQQIAVASGSIVIKEFTISNWLYDNFDPSYMTITYSEQTIS